VKNLCLLTKRDIHLCQRGFRKICYYIGEGCPWSKTEPRPAPPAPSPQGSVDPHGVLYYSLAPGSSAPVLCMNGPLGFGFSARSKAPDRQMVLLDRKGNTSIAGSMHSVGIACQKSWWVHHGNKKFPSRIKLYLCVVRPLSLWGTTLPRHRFPVHLRCACSLLRVRLAASFLLFSFPFFPF
jgi:hypothetical protein